MARTKRGRFTRAVTRYRYRGNPGRRRRRNFTIPVSIVAGFMPGVWRMWAHARVGGGTALATEAGRIYLGYDMITGQWNPGLMWYGTWPIVIGAVIHKAAGMLGINRLIARSGIPILRL